MVCVPGGGVSVLIKVYSSSPLSVFSHQFQHLSFRIHASFAPLPASLFHDGQVSSMKVVSTWALTNADDSRIFKCKGTVVLTPSMRNSCKARFMQPMA